MGHWEERERLFRGRKLKRKESQRDEKDRWSMLLHNKRKGAEQSRRRQLQRQQLGRWPAGAHSGTSHWSWATLLAAGLTVFLATTGTGVDFLIAGGGLDPLDWRTGAVATGVACGGLAAGSLMIVTCIRKRRRMLTVSAGGGSLDPHSMGVRNCTARRITAPSQQQEHRVVPSSGQDTVGKHKKQIRRREEMRRKAQERKAEIEHLQEERRRRHSSTLDSNFAGLVEASSPGDFVSGVPATAPAWEEDKHVASQNRKLSTPVAGPGVWSQTEEPVFSAPQGDKRHEAIEASDSASETDGSAVEQLVRQEQHARERIANEMDIPEASICPLTLEVIRDPVIDACGHSYERHAITAWLRTHTTSPCTNEAAKVAAARIAELESRIAELEKLLQAEQAEHAATKAAVDEHRTTR